MNVIELSDGDAAALQAKAARRGLTLQAWIKTMAEEETEDQNGASDPFPLQTAMGQVPPEAFANRPKDGASEHDHYLYGHSKRNS